MRTIFPYPVLNGDVALRVESVSLDGNPVLGRFVDSERREIQLRLLETTAWEVANVSLVIEGPASELAPSETPWQSIQAVALLECPYTSSRRSLELTPHAGAAFRWAGEIGIDRTEWFGAIELRGQLLGTVAEVDHRLIGSADPWRLWLDDVPRPPIGQAITMKWEHFSEPSDPWHFLKDYSAEPYFLRIDPHEPILFLNSDFENLQGLLTDRRGRPAHERALHDELRASIATEVWTALFIDALAQAEVDEEGEVRWPDEDWRKSALSSMLLAMFGAADDEVLARARQTLQEPESIGTLLERTLPGASKQARAAKLLRSAIQGVGSAPTEDEGEEGQ